MKKKRIKLRGRSLSLRILQRNKLSRMCAEFALKMTRKKSSLSHVNVQVL